MFFGDSRLHSGAPDLRQLLHVSFVLLKGEAKLVLLAGTLFEQVNIVSEVEQLFLEV